MELRVLNYFLEVAKEENISKAAEALHMTQPTLSRQIKQLEEELGTLLFIRDRNHLILTEDGRTLQRRANDIVELLDKTHQEFSSKGQNLEGTISIGCVETNNMKYLGAVIREYQRLYPHVSFEITSALTSNIEDSMSKGLIDFGIMMEPIDLSQYDFLSLPEKESWGILVGDRSPLAALPSVLPDDLQRIPLVFPARALLIKDGLKRWFGKAFDDLNIAVTYTLINNAVAISQQLDGALLCIHLPNIVPQGMKFVPLNGMEDLQTALVWKKYKVLSRACRQFIFHCNNTKIE